MLLDANPAPLPPLPLCPLPSLQNRGQRRRQLDPLFPLSAMRPARGGYRRITRLIPTNGKQDQGERYDTNMDPRMFGLNLVTIGSLCGQLQAPYSLVRRGAGRRGSRRGIDYQRRSSLQHGGRGASRSVFAEHGGRGPTDCSKNKGQAMNGHGQAIDTTYGVYPPLCGSFLPSRPDVPVSSQFFIMSVSLCNPRHFFTEAEPYGPQTT